MVEVHYDDEGTRDVYIKCKDLWTEPSWKKEKPKGYPSILESDEGLLFTRDILYITCKECKQELFGDTYEWCWDLNHDKDWFSAVSVIEPNIVLFYTKRQLSKKELTELKSTTNYQFKIQIEVIGNVKPL